MMMHLQHSAGNAAVAELVTVQLCGDVPCDCADHKGSAVAVQRDSGAPVVEAGPTIKPSAPTSAPAASAPASAPAFVARLESRYDIVIEKGDKDWSTSELKDLETALGKLDKAEAERLRGYHFIRWSTKWERMKLDKSYKDPGKDECGLHEMDLKGSESEKISMYDQCWGDPEATSETDYGIPVGQATILHEVGHAMASAELRVRWKDDQAATKALNDFIDAFNAASPKDQKKMKARLDKLQAAADRADARLKAAQDRAVKEFQALTADKDPLSDYSKTSADEAFAEAFKVYMANPTFLKKENPALYKWFSNHGELNPLKDTPKSASKKSK
jgi:hypothetical protein